MSSFFDTSAVAKTYHDEPGSVAMKRLATTSATAYISNLGVIEMYSVIANKVRGRLLTVEEGQAVRFRFLADIRRKALQVVALQTSHFAHAESLIQKYGDSEGLRTLDALQLAVALNLSDRKVNRYAAYLGQCLASRGAQRGTTGRQPRFR